MYVVGFAIDDCWATQELVVLVAESLLKISKLC